MSKQNGMSRIKRSIPWLLGAALFWAPAASQAATFLGYFKGQAACPGAGSDFLREDFTLTMDPGTGTGVLTVVGMPQLDVATDWIVDGNWSYFSASFVQDGAVVFNGWIKSGKWMKGNVAIHDYLTGCVVVARLKAYLQ